jgi:hypothetical protein
VGVVGEIVVKTWMAMEKFVQNGMVGRTPAAFGTNILLIGTKGVGNHERFCYNPETCRTCGQIY